MKIPNPFEEFTNLMNEINERNFGSGNAYTSKEKYDVYSDFDIDKHAKNFINYLEVCISPEGKVYYAVPSHTQFLEYVLEQQCVKNNKDYKKVINDNLHYWPNCLCDLTGYCMVWNDLIYKPSKGLTKAQQFTLVSLKTKHYVRCPHLTLYRGDI